MTISTFDALRFAELHYGVMTMISTASAFRVNAMTTPRKMLNEYIALAKKLNLRPYNEHFEADAFAVVERIENSQRELASLMQFGKKAA